MAGVLFRGNWLAWGIVPTPEISGLSWPTHEKFAQSWPTQEDAVIWLLTQEIPIYSLFAVGFLMIGVLGWWSFEVEFDD